MLLYRRCWGSPDGSGRPQCCCRYSPVTAGTEAEALPLVIVLERADVWNDPLRQPANGHRVPGLERNVQTREELLAGRIPCRYCALQTAATRRRPSRPSDQPLSLLGSNLLPPSREENYFTQLHRDALGTPGRAILTTSMTRRRKISMRPLLYSENGRLLRAGRPTAAFFQDSGVLSSPRTVLPLLADAAELLTQRLAEASIPLRLFRPPGVEAPPSRSPS